MTTATQNINFSKITGPDGSKNPPVLTYHMQHFVSRKRMLGWLASEPFTIIDN